MINNLICNKCNMECDTSCAALNTISRLYADLRNEEKTNMIRSLRKQLNFVDYEVANDLQELGERIIRARPELCVIRDYDVKIGYVRSYEAKRDKGKQVNADCRKVNGTYTAYLPYDFIITFYDPNIYYMTENQKKLLMLHELKHIGIGERGLRLENHDIEDFKDILLQYGIEWNGFNQEVPDILAGGDDEQQGTKRHKLEAESKATSNSGTSSKPRRSKNKDRENE